MSVKDIATQILLPILLFIDHCFGLKLHHYLYKKETTYDKLIFLQHWQSSKNQKGEQNLSKNRLKICRFL